MTNTIFITGGGSGIGRGLAEALHKLGNQIIISGRRQSHLDATTRANPGMASVQLDIEDPDSIAAVRKQLMAQFPSLNVLINNAGIMQIDDAAGGIDLAEFIEETISVLGTDAHEVLVERAKPLRNNPGPNESAFVTEFNDLMAQAPASAGGHMSA